MDEAHRAYYAARAREYDDWWLGRGLFAARDRPGWPEEVRELERLLADQRERFLDEARRVGDELVVVDSARREGLEDEQWQERKLNDGTRHRIYKRFFTGQALAAELGGGEVLHAGAWFVVVRS